MPIPLPNLDDRRFVELVEEGIRLIPGLAPSWTDHNASDPGITFIELFAYISEMLMYRANRITDANKQAFVKLLRGDPAWTFTLPVDEEIRQAVLELRKERRAVTPADFERLALEVTGVGRAYCLPRHNLDSNEPTQDAEAHISVLVVPTVPTADPRDAVKQHLLAKCLLTTRLHVAMPVYLTIAIKMTVHVFADQDEKLIKEQIKNQLKVYFDPINGGLDGKGLPFGKPVYVSDLYALVDAMPGVDYVTPYFDNKQPILVVDITRQIKRNGEIIGAALLPNELAQPDLTDTKSTIEISRQTEVIPQE